MNMASEFAHLHLVICFGHVEVRSPQSSDGSKVKSLGSTAPKLVPCTAAGIIKFSGLPGKTGTLAGCGHHIGNSWAVIGVRRMGLWWLVTLHSAQVKWTHEMIRSGWTPVTNGRYYNGATWPDRTAYLQTTVLKSGIPKLTMLFWRNEHKGCPFVQEVSTNDRTAQTGERKQIKETTSRYVKCFRNMDIIGQAPGR